MKKKLIEICKNTELFFPYLESNFLNTNTQLNFENDNNAKYFFDNIDSFNDEYILNLIELFLPFSGNLKDDYEKNKLLLDSNEKYKKENYYYQRLTNYNWLKQDGALWDGLKWVSGIVKNSPEVAINIIEEYINLYITDLKDARYYGLNDARNIIKARFLDYTIIDDPIIENNFWDSISPRNFEKVIYLIYQKMGYICTLTQQSRDGGFDVTISNNGIGKCENSIIECKTGKITVLDGRSLLGVLGNNLSYTKGILVAKGHITKDCIKELNDNGRIFIVNFSDIKILARENFGFGYTTILTEQLKMDDLFIIKKL